MGAGRSPSTLPRETYEQTKKDMALGAVGEYNAATVYKLRDFTH